jgi:endonuclease YncB( thermonuclease family)
VVYRRFDFRLKEEFLAAEAEARREKVGLWAR